MQYQKLTYEDTIIEFHNNWLGEETVIVNGQIVSKKSSVWGTNHYFTVIEKGHSTRYVLTSKVNSNLQVALDLIRNGTPVQENIPVKYGSLPRRRQNKAKKHGLLKLKEYDLEEALQDFEKALDLNARDPEIHFHMACAYSVMERTGEGFESLKKAIEYGLQDHEMILNHDMLAYIRMHAAFEDFLNSGFTNYDKQLIKKEDKDD